MHALVGNGGPVAVGPDPWLVQDPWQQAPKSGKPKPSKVASSKWEDMQIPHVDELEPQLSQIALSELQPEATGVVLTSMATVDRYKWVRSQNPLCMIVPGHDRDDLKQLLASGIGESAACAGELTPSRPHQGAAGAAQSHADQSGCEPGDFHSSAYGFEGASQ